MGIMEFVKKDLGKLSNPKFIKNVAIGGGLALTLLNMLNDKNDREAMKNEVIDEVYKKMTSDE